MSSRKTKTLHIPKFKCLKLALIVLFVIRDRYSGRFLTVVLSRHRSVLVLCRQCRCSYKCRCEVERLGALHADYSVLVLQRGLLGATKATHTLLRLPLPQRKMQMWKMPRRRSAQAPTPVTQVQFRGSSFHRTYAASFFPQNTRRRRPILHLVRLLSPPAAAATPQRTRNRTAKDISSPRGTRSGNS